VIQSICPGQYDPFLLTECLETWIQGLFENLASLQLADTIARNEKNIGGKVEAIRFSQFTLRLGSVHSMVGGIDLHFQLQF
jgi:hypothetical protein